MQEALVTAHLAVVVRRPTA